MLINQISHYPKQTKKNKKMHDFPNLTQDIISGLDLDLAQYKIDETCTQNGSYFAGKDVAMAARAASISRVFGTNHWKTFDVSLQNCLEKWLRVDGKL